MKRLRNQFFYLGSNVLRRLGYSFSANSKAKIVDMKRTIAALDGGGINFSIEQHPDGSWSAESKNIDGIITGGDSFSDRQDIIKDAILTYFEIPPYLCEEVSLRSDNEAITLEQKVRVSG